MRPIKKVLNRLEAVEESGNGYVALCPAHDDHSPSLSIDEDSDSQVLINCFAGCAPKDVVDAMGLEWRDLFPDDSSDDWDPFKEGELVDKYTYQGPDEEPLFQVWRFENTDRSHPAFGAKKFRQKAYRPEDTEADREGFVWGLSGDEWKVETVLYRLPHVLRAKEQGEPIWFVEGEKDVQTLETRGLTATTNPMGAGSWSDHLRKHLEGATVYLLPDNDNEGRRHIDEVKVSLLEVANMVKVVELPDLPHKGDVTSWIEAGHGIDELRQLAEETEPAKPVPTSIDELVSLVEETGEAADIFEHIHLLGAVSATEYGRVKGTLKDATGVNLNDLEAAVQEARERHEEKQAEAEREERRERLESKDVPMIVVSGRPSPEVVDEAITAFSEYNDPPEIYRRGGEPVRLQNDGRDRVNIEPVEDGLWDDIVSRSAEFVDKKYRPRDLPLRLVQRVRVRADLPELRGITRVPLMRPDGSLLTEPGFDSATGYLYHPHGEATEVPDDPTVGDVEEAVCFVQEAWTDHPFADEASEANVLALPLTLLLHPYLEGASVPLAIIDATRAGSGKTLLAQIAGLIGTGRMPASMSAPTGDAEWRKQITAQLRRGERFVVVDDVSGTIESASLRRALTSPMWSDRILGASEQLRLPSETVWAATGNNLRPRGDMVRRCFLVRLDTEMVRPYRRTGFTHEQPEWTRERRSELAAALLTIARAWIVAGRPEPSNLPVMGGFMEWVRTIGGILKNAEVKGFLQNLDELEDTAHSEDHQWAGLLAAIYEWMEYREEETFQVRTLVRSLENDVRELDRVRDDRLRQIADHLPGSLQTELRRGEAIGESLGRALTYRDGRRFEGGWYLERVGRDRDGVVWTVSCDDVTDESSDARTRESPTLPSGERGGGDPPHGHEDRSSHHHERAEEAPF